MRKILVGTAIIGSLLVLSTGPANARPKNPQGTIELRTEIATLDELFAVIASGADASYGDTVEFETSVSGVSNRATVYITVVCKQGSTVVYQASAAPDASFELTDQAGDNLEWDGQSADCEAWLQHLVKKGKGYTVTNLDIDDFTVAA